MGKRKQEEQIGQEMFRLLDRYCDNTERELGEVPLRVHAYTKGVQVRVDDPTDDVRWVDPKAPLEEVFDRISSDAINNHILGMRFLSGEIAVDNKVYFRRNGKEVQFISFDPLLVVTVKLSTAASKLSLQGEDNKIHLLEGGKRTKK